MENSLSCKKMWGRKFGFLGLGGAITTHCVAY